MSRRWLAGALLVFAAADLVLFASLWRNDPREVALLPAREVYRALAAAEAPPQPVERWDGTARNDLRFVVWLIARNARTLVTRPWALFDAEVCYPTPRALALGEPGISQGVLAAPAALLSSEPIAIYNASLLLLPLLSGLAMFLLVRAWSGSPPAGIAAGLLYGFHVVKTWDVVHPYVWDTGWTVLALWLSLRLCEHARWRDAVALAACISLQIAGSFYALLSAVVIALPFLAWLAWHYRPGPAVGLRFGVAAGLAGLAALWVLGPYLELRDAGVLAPRTTQHFLLQDWVRPGGVLFLGVPLLGLAALGLLAPRRRCLRLPGDPRWALALAGAVLFLLSAGGPVDPELGRPAPWFDVWGRLLPWVPGLDVIRSPASLYSGTHLALCVLAGLGLAGLLHSLPERARGAAALAGVLLAAGSALLERTWVDPEGLGFRAVALRPAPEALRFFETLARQGDRGPILEVPVPPDTRVPRVTESILLAFHHGRPTSACYNSYLSPELEQARRAAEALPARGGIHAARQLGFTTILVHHAPDAPFAEPRRRAFERFAARHPDGPLQLLHANAAMSAYRIEPAPGGR
jgi:hypothetical protein